MNTSKPCLAKLILPLGTAAVSAVGQVFFFNLIEISDGHIIFADVKIAYYTYRHKNFGTPSPLISILRRAEKATSAEPVIIVVACGRDLYLTGVESSDFM